MKINKQKLKNYLFEIEHFFKKLLYWYWRQYKSVPHADEMLKLYSDNFPKSLEQKNKYRWAEITLDYLWTMDIEETAQNYKVARERVRQCIWKAYRKWTGND